MGFYSLCMFTNAENVRYIKRFGSTQCWKAFAYFNYLIRTHSLLIATRLLLCSYKKSFSQKYLEKIYHFIAKSYREENLLTKLEFYKVRCREHIWVRVHSSREDVSYLVTQVLDDGIMIKQPICLVELYF